MPLETGDFIPELDPNNPLGADNVSLGDDHLRLLKRAVTGSFPAFVGTNAIPKSVALTEDQINDTALQSESPTFTGAIGLTIAADNPKLVITDDNALLDEKNYVLNANGGIFGIHTADDATPGVNVEAAFLINRTGSVIDDITFDHLSIHNASVRFDAGALILENNLNISGIPLSGIGSVRFARFNPSDVWEIGQASSAVQGHEYDCGSTGSVHRFEVSNSHILNIGDEGIVLQDAMRIQIRNDADTADIFLIGRSNTSDTMVIGDANVADIQYFSRSGNSAHRFFNAGIEVARWKDADDGGGSVIDRNNVLQSIGFRGGSEIGGATTTDALQSWEDRPVNFGSGGTVTFNTLTGGTQFTLTNRGGPLTLLEGTATIRWLNGDGINHTGDRTVISSSVVQCLYRGASAVEIWGNGIS